MRVLRVGREKHLQFTSVRYLFCYKMGGPSMLFVSIFGIKQILTKVIKDLLLKCQRVLYLLNVSYLLIYECLPRISWILMNCYQWGSCLLCEKPTKEPMELTVNSNFHHRRPHGGSNSEPFDPKLNALTTRPRIHSG